MFNKPKIVMEKSKPILKVLFLNKCKKLIDEYENTSVFWGRVSSKLYLVNRIKSCFTYKYNLRSLKLNELNARCHLFLEGIIWYELHRKQYYLPEGGIDLNNYGAAMRGVHDECLLWLLNNKFISQKQFDKKLFERNDLIFLAKDNLELAS